MWRYYHQSHIQIEQTTATSNETFFKDIPRVGSTTVWSVDGFLDRQRRWSMHNEYRQNDITEFKTDNAFWPITYCVDDLGQGVLMNDQVINLILLTPQMKSFCDYFIACDFESTLLIGRDFLFNISCLKHQDSTVGYMLRKLQVRLKGGKRVYQHSLDFYGSESLFEYMPEYLLKGLGEQKAFSYTHLCEHLQSMRMSFDSLYRDNKKAEQYLRLSSLLKPKLLHNIPFIPSSFFLLWLVRQRKAEWFQQDGEEKRLLGLVLAQWPAKKIEAFCSNLCQLTDTENFFTEYHHLVKNEKQFDHLKAAIGDVVPYEPSPIHLKEHFLRDFSALSSNCLGGHLLLLEALSGSPKRDSLISLCKQHHRLNHWENRRSLSHVELRVMENLGGGFSEIVSEVEAYHHKAFWQRWWYTCVQLLLEFILLPAKDKSVKPFTDSLKDAIESHDFDVQKSEGYQMGHGLGLVGVSSRRSLFASPAHCNQPNRRNVCPR